jgi:O-antigen ligase
LGAHPHWSHHLLYPLVIGLAATLADRREQELALRATGHALLLLMLLGLLLIPIMPTLVLDRQYAQGWLPGLPRFGGLATHPVSMGLLAQLGLLCLLARPLPKVWLNRAAWLMGLAVLFMAQSKTAWLAFVLCTAVVLLVRGWPRWQAQLGQVRPPMPALLVLGLALLGIAGALALLVLGDPGGRLERFLLSPEGSQLSALTGRDRIWAIAWQEWQAHPWFGWGLPIWDDAYRRAIGMSHATHAHNQLMDTLSRSGLVGAAALLGYTMVLGVLALRHARATQGLSVALLLALLLRAGSEVPLLLMGYGPDLIAHLLLLMTLAAQGAGANRGAEPLPARSPAAKPAPHRPAGLGATTGRWLSAAGPRRP